MCSASTFPPGPRGLPIIGSLTSSQPYPQRAFKKWSLEEYGPIMSVNMGSRTPVILTTVDAIKEVSYCKSNFLIKMLMPKTNGS